MAQDGRAVIAAILAFTIIEFAQFAFADSNCPHCTDNVVVSPFREYFRSIKDDSRSQSVVKPNDQSNTGNSDPVKNCMKMCVLLAQDKLTGSLLEKNLQESISKLLFWLKTFVKDSFAVEENTNSIRRKRQAQSNYYDYGDEELEMIAPEYDQLNLPNDNQPMDNAEIWMNQADYEEYEEEPMYDDSFERTNALPNPTGRYYHRNHRKLENPGPRSDCLAKQQKLFNDVLNLLDQITEKAIEQLQEMVRKEVERELTDIGEVPLWWLISLQQNNFILPLTTQDQIKGEGFLDATETPENSADDVTPAAGVRTSVPSSSRSTAMAASLSGPDDLMWYPFQLPVSQSWYPYQNMPYGQPWPSYAPSSSQGWYSNESSPGKFVSLSTNAMPTQGKPFIAVASPPYAQQPAMEMAWMVTTPVQANHDAPEKAPGLTETPKEPGTTSKIPDTPPKVPEMTPKIPEMTPKIPEMTPEIPEMTPKKPEIPTATPETPPTIMTTPEISSGPPDTTSVIPETTMTIPEATNQQETTPEKPETIPQGESSPPQGQYPHGRNNSVLNLPHQPETTTEDINKFASTTTETDERDSATESEEGVHTSDQQKETTDSSEVTVGQRFWDFGLGGNDVPPQSDCNNNSEMDHFLPAILEVFNLEGH